MLDLEEVDLCAFADNTVILCKDNNITKVLKTAQKAINKVQTWLIENLISLNVDKTK